MESHDFPAIKKSIEKTRKLAKKGRDLEQSSTGWTIYNSSLESGPNSFQAEFGALVPKQFANLRSYLESYLEKKKGQAIGLEIGGSGEFFPNSLQNYLQEQQVLLCRTKDQRIEKFKIPCDIMR